MYEKPNDEKAAQNSSCYAGMCVIVSTPDVTTPTDDDSSITVETPCPENPSDENPDAETSPLGDDYPFGEEDE